MTDQAQFLFYALMLLLPLSALIARRPSISRTLKGGLAWAAMFGVALLVAAYRDRLPSPGALLSGQEVVGGETRINMDPDGHFYARVGLNGVERRMLIDSGATVTALSLATARAAGVDADGSAFPVMLDTANGAVEARRATIERVEIGAIVARDLAVVVSPAFGDVDVIGMNFLSELSSWRVQGRTLVLTPKSSQTLHNVYYRFDGVRMSVDRLRAVMARLRDPEHGCEWDREQTFATIAPYTIEEAYEVADAIDRGDRDDIRDELGDLLLQVVFHSRIAEEAGLFDLDGVAEAISDKMERRHPHIFGGAAGTPGWEAIKATERGSKPGGALAGVALGMPALSRAEKLQRRAARVGFDWPDASGPRDKVTEELLEVENAPSDEIEGEVGDLLFAIVNWARHLGVDAEAALRAANRKFEQRFEAMEALAGPSFPTLSLDQKEALWVEVKARPGAD